MFTKCCQIFKSYLVNVKKTIESYISFKKIKFCRQNRKLFDAKNLVEWKRKCEAKHVSGSNFSQLHSVSRDRSEFLTLED